VAFGRDGSERELTIYDFQNRACESALKKIIRKSKEPEIKQIAREALQYAEKLIDKI